MKERWMWRYGIILVLILAIMVLVSVTHGPAIEGYSIRSWIKLSTSTDPKNRRRASEAFERLPDPVPVCLALLKIKPTPWERAYAIYWPVISTKLPFQILRRFPPPNMGYEGLRYLSLDRLQRMGPRASNSVPTLIKLLDDTNNIQSLFFPPASGIGIVRKKPQVWMSSGIPRSRIAETLAHIGSGAAASVPALLRIVDEGKFDALNAIKAISQIGVTNEAVIQTLARATSNRAFATRFEAAVVLWKLEHRSKRLLRLLPLWLEDSQLETSQRTQIASLITQVTEADTSGIPILERVRNDKDVTIRCIAAHALWKLDGQTNTYVRAQTEMLKEGPEGQRWFSLDNLVPFVGQNDLALPALIGALNDESFRVRGRTASILGNLGSTARPAIPALLKATNDSWWNVREAAAGALEKIQASRPSSE